LNHRHLEIDEVDTKLLSHRLEQVGIGYVPTTDEQLDEGDTIGLLLDKQMLQRVTAQAMLVNESLA
jgi:hypothetical protein